MNIMEWLGYVPVSDWNQLVDLYSDHSRMITTRLSNLEAYLIALQKRTPHDVIKKEIDDVLR
jgi:hypothetical protein